MLYVYGLWSGVQIFGISAPILILVVKPTTINDMCTHLLTVQFIKLTLHWDTLETRFIEPVNWFLTQLCLSIVQSPRMSGIIFVFDLYFNTYTPKAWLKWSRVGWLIWRDGLSPISNGCRFVTINSGSRLLLFNMYLSISVRLTGCSDSQFRCIT